MLLISATAQAVPAPVIHTREEYNNIPIGGKYWYNNRLETKRAELVATPTPTPRVTPTPPPLGSSANFPIQVNSREEYDKLPAGTWMRDGAGDVVQKAPTVLTQKDLDAIPHGGKYWYQGRLLTKWGGTAQATPTPSTIWTEEDAAHRRPCSVHIRICCLNWRERPFVDCNCDRGQDAHLRAALQLAEERYPSATEAKLAGRNIPS
jgi:hypothetical protein